MPLQEPPHLPRTPPALIEKYCLLFNKLQVIEEIFTVSTHVRTVKRSSVMYIKYFLFLVHKKEGHKIHKFVVFNA
jgi:hypothetical protein